MCKYIYTQIWVWPSMACTARNHRILKRDAWNTWAAGRPSTLEYGHLGIWYYPLIAWSASTKPGKKISGWNRTNPSESTFQTKNTSGILWSFCPSGWVNIKTTCSHRHGQGRQRPERQNGRGRPCWVVSPERQWHLQGRRGSSCCDKLCWLQAFHVPLFDAISINPGFVWFVKLKKIESYGTNSCGRIHVFCLYFLFALSNKAWLTALQHQAVLLWLDAFGFWTAGIEEQRFFSQIFARLNTDMAWYAEFQCRKCGRWTAKLTDRALKLQRWNFSK